MTKEKKLVMITVIGGVLGGIVSLISQWDVLFVIKGVNMEFMFKMILAPSIQGAVAAMLGVFLFSPGKPEHLVKTFSFALACGLAFPTYIKKATELGNDTKQEIIANTAINASNEVYAELQSESIDADKAIKELKWSSGLMIKSHFPKEVAESPLVVSNYLAQNRGGLTRVKEITGDALILNMKLVDVINGQLSEEVSNDFINFNQSLNDSIKDGSNRRN